MMDPVLILISWLPVFMVGAVAAAAAYVGYSAHKERFPAINYEKEFELARAGRPLSDKQTRREEEEQNPAKAKSAFHST